MLKGRKVTRCSEWSMGRGWLSRDFSLSLPWDCQDTCPCLWHHLSNPKEVSEGSAGVELLKAKLINNVCATVQMG